MKSAKEAYKRMQVIPSHEDDINKYFALKKANLLFNSRVCTDFKQVYEWQLDLFTKCPTQEKGFLAGVRSFVKKPVKEQDPTESVRTEATALYSTLTRVTDEKYKAKLQTSITALEQAIGYAPGINWSSLGAKGIGIGVLSLASTKFVPGPLKAVTLLLGCSALAAGILAFAYGYCKANGNDEKQSVKTRRILEQYSEVAGVEKQVKEVIGSIKKDSQPTLSKVKLNLERWVQGYKNNYQNEVTQVLEIVR
jgi:hypothetical protein